MIERKGKTLHFSQRFDEPLSLTEIHRVYLNVFAPDFTASQYYLSIEASNCGYWVTVDADRKKSGAGLREVNSRYTEEYPKIEHNCEVIPLPYRDDDERIRFLEENIRHEILILIDRRDFLGRKYARYPEEIVRGISKTSAEIITADSTFRYWGC